MSITACYLEPNEVCSDSIRGTVNVVSNTCPRYVGDTEFTVSPTLTTGARAFTLQVRDSDPGDLGELEYQLIGDAFSLRDFSINNQGEVRTRSSFASSNVAVYNMQVIVSDQSAFRPCFISLNVRVVINRNTNAPRFTNTSVTIDLLETYSVLNEILTLRVCSRSH